MRTDLQRLKRDYRERTQCGGKSSCRSGCEAMEDCGSRDAGRLLIAGGLYYRSHQQRNHLTDKDTIVLADFANKHGRCNLR